MRAFGVSVVMSFSGSAGMADTVRRRVPKGGIQEREERKGKGDFLYIYFTTKNIVVCELLIFRKRRYGAHR